MIEGNKEEKKYLPANLFEGMVSVRAVARSENGRKILRVLFDRENVSKKREEYALLRRLSEVKGFPIELTDRETIDRLTVGNSHGGVVAECTDRVLPTLSEADLPEKGFFFLLDGVEDPYNFGFCLRSLYAAGADGVILTPRNWMTAAGVVCRSSAGASEEMPLFVSEETQAVEMAKQRGYTVWCAEMKDSESIFEARFSRPLLIVIGGEKRGIKKEVLRMADRRVRIDYARPFSAALSAVSASTVIAFEAMRQMKENP